MRQRPDTRSNSTATALPAHVASQSLRAILLLAAIAALLLASVLSANAAPAFPENIPLPNGWAPEGIATGRGTDFYVGSLANGGIYKGDLRTGTGAVLVDGEAGRSIVGIKVDARTNYIFASGRTSGKAFVFDAATGTLLAEYLLTTKTPSFINDVVVTRDAAYFTNSNQPELYRLPLGPGGSLPAVGDIEVISLGGDYVQVGGFNANGIDATPDGKRLIIVQSATGYLFTVDPATGSAIRIDVAGGDHDGLVSNGDGILLLGRTLYVVQNQLNKIAVIDVNLVTNTGTVTGYITDPAFRVPTTIAAFGKSLYAVNARFGTPVTPDTDYDVVKVDK